MPTRVARRVRFDRTARAWGWVAQDRWRVRELERRARARLRLQLTDARKLINGPAGSQAAEEADIWPYHPRHGVLWEAW
jgi:hypothetical protein